MIIKKDDIGWDLFASVLKQEVAYANGTKKYVSIKHGQDKDQKPKAKYEVIDAEEVKNEKKISY